MEVLVSDYDAHADIYDSQRPFHHIGDIEFYAKCAAEYGSSVLEVCVGTGRVAIPLAKAGYEVVGIDSSPAMLDRFRVKLGDTSIEGKVDLHEADMRDFDLGRTFPLVIIPFRAFLHNMNTDDQIKCLQTIARHMTDDSRLIIAFFVPSIPIIAKRIGDRRPIYTTDYVHPKSGRTTHVWCNMGYEPFEQQIRNIEVHEEFDDSGLSVRRVVRHLNLCWIWPREAALLFRAAGFTIEKTYGGFNGEPLDKDASEQVYLLRLSG
jgi:ubiquinone/menaquinone biosynthesis C-methylase UbiE